MVVCCGGGGVGCLHCGLYLVGVAADGLYLKGCGFGELLEGAHVVGQVVPRRRPGVVVRGVAGVVVLCAPDVLLYQLHDGVVEGSLLIDG